MSVSVYLAHSVTEGELPVLWELQAVAAGRGITLHLAKYRPLRALTDSRRHNIDRCDVLAAVITQFEGAPPALEEIEYARSIKKPVVVFTVPGANLTFGADVNLVVLQPGATPETLANELAGLYRVHITDDKEVNGVIGAFLGVGAALLILYLLCRE